MKETCIICGKPLDCKSPYYCRECVENFIGGNNDGD